MTPTIPGIENMARLSALLLGFAAVIGCTSGLPPSPILYQNLGDPRRDNFTIGPSDVIRVTVLLNPEASAESVHVRPDGRVTLPLVGELVAAGKTTLELESQIADGLRAYIKDPPRVTVSIVDVNSYQIVVIGNVGRAGVFPLKKFITVSEALALAGGLGRFARDELVVVRTWNRKGDPPLRIPVSYQKITTGQAPEQDIALYSGDTVIVP